MFVAANVISFFSHRLRALKITKSGGFALQHRGIGIAGSGGERVLGRLQGVFVIHSRHILPGGGQSMEVGFAQQIGADGDGLVGF